MRVETATLEPRPWKWGLAWLAVLGPFFFASYGFANWVTAQRPAIPAIVFGWEHAIPYLPWTIAPYWLIDLLYGISLLLCATRAQLRTHVSRLLFVQIIAVLCFLAFPLRFTFERPAADGAFGWMFAALESFDQPYNQAPSLHVALLVVLWPVYLRALPKPWHGIVHGVALLIGISVLTTWQHHFIDLPTGAWLGCLAVWLFRERRTAGDWRLDRCTDPQRRKLAAYYALGAALLCSTALLGGGAWLWSSWPAASLFLVALVYLFGDGRACGKQPDGSFPAAAWFLLAPYFAGARINAWLWTRTARDPVEVAPGIHLGSIVRPWPHAGESNAAIVDMCAELPAPAAAARHRAIPVLDLTVPSMCELQTAALAIDAERMRGPVLVACALGFSRSAAAAAAWLVHARMAASVDEAIVRIREARPAVVLGPGHVEALRAWHRARQEDTGAMRDLGAPASSPPMPRDPVASHEGAT